MYTSRARPAGCATSWRTGRRIRRCASASWWTTRSGCTASRQSERPGRAGARQARIAYSSAPRRHPRAHFPATSKRHTHAMVQRAQRHRASHVRRRLRRLGRRRARLHGLHFRDLHAHQFVGHRQGAGRHAGHRHAAVLGAGRLARGHPGRPLRPRARAAIHHPVVLGLHGGHRLRAELRTTVRAARAARPGLRRRVGRRLGADGRDRPRPASRQGRGHGAERLGGGLGRGGDLVHAGLLAAAA